jgi:DNA-binding transcriptional regulator YiaG
MSPEEMRAIRESMHLSARGLARLMERSPTAIIEMEAGKRAIPDSISVWLRLLRNWLIKNPPPPKSR